MYARLISWSLFAMENVCMRACTREWCDLCFSIRFILLTLTLLCCILHFCLIGHSIRNVRFSCIYNISIYLSIYPSIYAIKSERFLRFFHFSKQIIWQTNSNRVSFCNEAPRSYAYMHTEAVLPYCLVHKMAKWTATGDDTHLCSGVASGTIPLYHWPLWHAE